MKERVRTRKKKDWNIYNLNEKEKYMKREREGQETIKALEKVNKIGDKKETQKERDEKGKHKVN